MIYRPFPVPAHLFLQRHPCPLMFLIDAAKLIPRVKASVDLEGERLGHGSLVGRANVMVQGTSISNLIGSIFTLISSMLVGSPPMDDAVGQMRSTFMQCRAELAHPNSHGSPPGGFMTKSELCALSKRVATSSLVRLQQRIGAVAFSLSPSLVAP